MHARGIDGDRLLGEDVLARLDRRLKMQRPEVRRRAEQDDVDTAVQKLLVGVEPHEAAVGGDSRPSTPPSRLASSGARLC